MHTLVSRGKAPRRLAHSLALAALASELTSTEGTNGGADEQQLAAAWLICDRLTRRAWRARRPQEYSER